MVSSRKLHNKPVKMLTDDHGNASIELACGLAQEVVHTFGEVRLRVFGTSMVPSLLPGDLVSIQRVALNEISLGEVVLFSRNGRLFIHRVVDRRAAATADSSGGPCLLTRGDRLRQMDAPVSSAEFLGRLISIERDNRRVDLPAIGTNRLIARLLQSSDRLTYLYLRLAEVWRTTFLRRAKCRA